MHSPSPLSTHPRPIFHPMVYISNVKKHHIEINAPKSFIKVRITFFFFKLLKMIKRNLESYYSPFLKERNVFYRVPSITNFPKFSMGFRGPENGQIKSYSSLKMGPGCFLCLWGVSLWLKFKRKINKFLRSSLVILSPNFAILRSNLAILSPD